MDIVNKIKSSMRQEKKNPLKTTRNVDVDIFTKAIAFSAARVSRFPNM